MPLVSVMAGLVLAIHVFVGAGFVKGVDARDKRGHDESERVTVVIKSGNPDTPT